MRILVTGAEGQLGRALLEALGPRHQVRGIDLAELDLTDAPSVEAAIAGIGPEVVINCAAMTQVDHCEREPARAYLQNSRTVAHLVGALRPRAIRLVQISTDYVFDGMNEAPYSEESPALPLNAYGRSKLLGERYALLLEDALLVRTQWLYHRGGRNFAAAILNQARKGEGLKVIDDQFGRPTFAPDLAEAIDLLISEGCSGIYHAANSGRASWYEFARAILEESGLTGTDVAPVLTDPKKYAAPRPMNTVLGLDKLIGRTGVKPRHWREALRDYFR